MSVPRFGNMQAAQPMTMATAAGGTRRAGISRTAIRQFALCFFSLEMLMLAGLYGTVAVVAYMLPWIVFAITRWRVVQRCLVADWPLLLMPALAILSSLWSPEHGWTLKAGLELGATTAIAVVAGETMRPRVLLGALMMVLLSMAIASAIVGLDHITGESQGALNGIFESKNAFSAAILLLLLTCVSVYTDKGIMVRYRLIALFGIAISPILLYYGRSLDAIFAAILTVGIFFYLRLLAHLPRAVRLLALLVGIAAITIGLLVIVMFDFDPMSILGMVGKDTSLTGRTHLWERAIDFIGERPVLGIGYRAFWRSDNPGARELWDYSHVKQGAGFNFHNEYLEILVENGIVGLILTMGYFAVMAKGVLKAAFRDITVEKSFATLMFVTIVLRTPLEASLFNQFSIMTIVFCLIWIYLKPLRNERPV